MSTFLEICKDVRLECGVAGDGPVTVTNQTGVYQKIVQRTARAWRNIQTERFDWRFMRANAPLVLTVGVREYTPANFGISAVFSRWDRDNFYLYEVSNSDRTQPTWDEYTDFHGRYKTFPDGRPSRFCFNIGNTGIEFEKTPDKAYTLNAGYFINPVTLAANGDVPNIPEAYHDVIMWRSVMLFAGNEEATNLYNHAKSQHDMLYLKLMVDQAEMPSDRRNFPIAQGNRTVTIRP